ncbi:MAG: hypothetical protein R3B82_11535 [Sandaracinaceae bacterium]
MLRFALAVVLLVGCGSSPPPTEVPSPSERPAVGALTSLIPPESRLIVVASPDALLTRPETARVVRAVFSDEHLERFAARTGVDLRALTELVVGVTPEGRVAIARGPIDALMAVREAGERMAPVEAQADEPIVRRVGFLGRGRIDASALDDETILHVDGPPLLAAEVLDAAEQVATDRHDPWSGCPIGAHAGAPLLLCAPHPLGLPPDSGIGLLLAREEALVASVRPEEDLLRFAADMTGEFPPGVDDNLHAFAESLGESDLGAALGIRDSLPSLRIEAEEGHVRLSAAVDPAVLAAGLRALLVAEIEELIEGSEPGDGP